MSNGRIPQDVIDAVLKHHDIAEVVGKYVSLTKQGHYMKGLCPFHSEKTPSFTVTPSKQIYHCFGCGAGGGILSFVMEIEGCTFAEAVIQLAEDAGVQVAWEEQSDEQDADQIERRAMLEAHDLAAKLYHHILINMREGKEAMEYLRQRGITQKLIETFSIGYAPDTQNTLSQFLQRRGFDPTLMEQGGLITRRNEQESYFDRFRNRIIFPIANVRGQVIGFAGRSLGDIQPKYLNSSETKIFSKGRLLFNLHQARTAVRKTQELVLFEGYMDVIKAWGASVMNGVATMGTALSDEHAAIIRRYTDQVTICFDGDHAGQSAAYKSIATLEQARCSVKVAVLPQGMDPDEYIEQHGADSFVSQIVQSAIPAIAFKLKHMKKNFRMNETDGKLRYIDAALKVIADLTLPTEREHYLRELSQEFHYSYEALKQQMNQVRQSLQKKWQQGDNNNSTWNNDMNNSGVAEQNKPLLPANYNAERKLLEVMMHDKEVTERVRQQIEDQFVEESHAALAVYLYRYYALDNEPNISKFISTLQDDKLESLASSISIMDTYQGANDQVIDDYIQIIKRYKEQIALIEQKKEQFIRAERSGEPIQAAMIGKEIITLERQLKSL